jgi:hypothetical protein
MNFQSELVRFNAHLSVEIFSEGYPALILYRSEQQDTEKKYEQLMKTVAQELRGKIKVVISDIVSDVEKNFADFLGLKKEDLPTVRIFDARETLKKYTMYNEVTYQNIYKFYSDWKANKLNPYTKSDKVVPFEYGKLFRLVTSNYWQRIFEAEKDVIVLYYRMTDTKWDEPVKVFEQLAKICIRNHNLYISSIELNGNEIQLFETPSTPYVRLFPAGKKNGHFEYKEKTINLLDLQIFLKKYTKNRINFEKTDL